MEDEKESEYGLIFAAKCSINTLLHMTGLVEKGDWAAAKEYAKVVRELLRLAENYNEELKKNVH